ncbi:lysylphosphatidylglycerol synthase domain-containing protein [Actinomadura scrupuli]|uniref:lysylphosphatidylglycerol synthase domain-containing protein n=1 Tax=Actinomadura scrupuli TaxID=559629 RepID=UPI003D98B237
MGVVIGPGDGARSDRCFPPPGWTAELSVTVGAFRLDRPLGGVVAVAVGDTQRGVPLSARERPPGTAKPRRRGRTALRTAVSTALVALVFVFALPHFASYRSAWAGLQLMTWPYALGVAAAAVASMICFWIMICSVLPSLRLREAALVNLASTAVANTFPAGGALALGISWRMLSSWGVSTTDYMLYTLISGLWNVFALLGLPVFALLVTAATTRADTVHIAAAATGLAALVALAAGLGLLLHSEPVALAAARALRRAAAIACRLARRPPPAHLAEPSLAFRDRATDLLTVRGWRISAATAAGHLTLWLTLLTCLRGVGLSQSQIPWQTSLAAFTAVRLITALPITPGGAGITELGLVGSLASGAGHPAGAQIAAAVLLYRAATYLLPIPLGALAYLTWRHAPAPRPQSTSVSAPP